MQQSAEYIFILGRYPDLSMQEITAVFRKNGLACKIVQQSKQVALLQAKDNLPVDGLNKTLGGTVKIAKVIRSVPIDLSTVERYVTSEAFLLEFFGDVVGRVHYGLSLYVCGGKDHVTREIKGKLNAWTTLIKDVLAEKNILSRFPNRDGEFLSSVSVVKNKLLSAGAEVIIVLTQDRILIAKTLAVQEFEAFSQRDYGRPVRDMRSGVMPPKLARMMLNIAQVKKNDAVLDPFCGSGTMVQEALYLGCTTVTGTDFSEKAIKDTKENIAWLEKNIALSDRKILIDQYDVTQIADRFGPAVFDAIVTEPYLGPNLRQNPSMKEIERIQSELRTLFLQAWKQFSLILKPGGVVVMILPAHNAGRHFVYMQVLEEIKQLGFTQISLSQQPRQSLLVGNTHDYVLREIVKFVKS